MDQRGVLSNSSAIGGITGDCVPFHPPKEQKKPKKTPQAHYRGKKTGTRLQGPSARENRKVVGWPWVDPQGFGCCMRKRRTTAKTRLALQQSRIKNRYRRCRKGGPEQDERNQMAQTEVTMPRSVVSMEGEVGGRPSLCPSERRRGKRRENQWGKIKLEGSGAI